MTAATTGAPMRSAFRHRAFALFWSARVCSMLAIQMQVVAVGWQVYDMIGDPLDLGLAGLWAWNFPALRRIDRLSAVR